MVFLHPWYGKIILYIEKKNMVGKLLRLNLLIKKDLGGKLTKNQFGLMEKSMIT